MTDPSAEYDNCIAQAANQLQKENVLHAMMFDTLSREITEQKNLNLFVEFPRKKMLALLFKTDCVIEQMVLVYFIAIFRN